MTNNHCSEQALQQYATQQLIPDAASMEHIKSCALCQQQIAAYQLIIAGIEEHPAASFDFDLESVVLQQLQPIKTTKAPANQFYTAIPFVLIALLVIVSLYFFRNNFINLSAAIPYSFMAISIVMCLCIIILKVIKLFQRYNQQIKKLNFSEYLQPK